MAPIRIPSISSPTFTVFASTFFTVVMSVIRNCFVLPTNFAVLSA